MSLEAEMLARIQLSRAPQRDLPDARAGHPHEHGQLWLFGWTELFGLPIEPRDDVPPQRFRIDCPGSAWKLEEELEDAVGEPLTVTPEIAPDSG